MHSLIAKQPAFLLKIAANQKAFLSILPGIVVYLVGCNLSEIGATIQFYDK